MVKTPQTKLDQTVICRIALQYGEPNTVYEFTGRGVIVPDPALDRVDTRDLLEDVSATALEFGEFLAYGENQPALARKFKELRAHHRIPVSPPITSFQCGLSIEEDREFPVYCSEVGVTWGELPDGLFSFSDWELFGLDVPVPVKEEAVRKFIADQPLIFGGVSTAFGVTGLRRCQGCVVVCGVYVDISTDDNPTPRISQQQLATGKLLQRLRPSWLDDTGDYLRVQGEFCAGKAPDSVSTEELLAEASRSGIEFALAWCDVGEVETRARFEDAIARAGRP